MLEIEIEYYYIYSNIANDIEHKVIDDALNNTLNSINYFIVVYLRQNRENIVNKRLINKTIH